MLSLPALGDSVRPSLTTVLCHITHCRVMRHWFLMARCLQRMGQGLPRGMLRGKAPVSWEGCCLYSLGIPSQHALLLSLQRPPVLLDYKSQDALPGPCTGSPLRASLCVGQLVSTGPIDLTCRACSGGQVRKKLHAHLPWPLVGPGRQARGSIGLLRCGSSAALSTCVMPRVTCRGAIQPSARACATLGALDALLPRLTARSPAASAPVPPWVSPLASLPATRPPRPGFHQPGL